MKKILLWLAIFSFATTGKAFSQLLDDHDLYNSAIGVRLGIYPGISFKDFFSNVSAFELIGQTKYKGIIGVLLYEAHFQAFGVRRLHWLLGFGGHVGKFPAGKLADPDGEVYDREVYTFGIDGIFGLEYFFETAPLTFGIDIKPFFDLVNPGPDVIDAAVTIRYAF